MSAGNLVNSTDRGAGSPVEVTWPLSGVKDEKGRPRKTESCSPAHSWHQHRLATPTGTPFLKAFHPSEKKGHLFLLEPDGVPSSIAANCLPPES